MLFWTVGDFSIQRGTRRYGNVGTLFLIGIVGMIGLFPFVQNELITVVHSSKLLSFFILLAVLTLVAALLLFEGLKRGKLAVIEPVFGLELPFTVFFSIVIGREHLATNIYAIIALLFVGLFFVSAKDLRSLRLNHIVVEGGVFFAAFGSVLMGLMNFMTGVGSQNTSALFAIWAVHSSLAVMCFIYMLVRGQIPALIEHIRKNPKTAIGLSFFDNGAWIFYCYSMVLIPISIATALSESYIVLAAFLGVFVNKEKLNSHQVVGIVISVVCAISLGMML
jgi:drug/metabolite transporter (DMT)-like permease